MPVPDVSPYLLLPRRSLEEACIELKGCAGYRALCPACEFAEICPRGSAYLDGPTVADVLRSGPRKH